MDILAHSLWAGAGAKKLNNSLENKKKKKVSILWSAFWGIFPDLFAFTLPFIISFWKVFSGQQDFGSFTTRHQVADGFNLAHDLYQYSHSLVIFLLIFLIIWLIYKKPWIPILGWGLHILLDIPSHPIEFFPTPFLFPISNYHFPYGVHWSSPIFMIINYSLLVIIFAIFIFKKNKK